MGVRAIIDVRDDTDQQRRFWSAWASPHYQIPHLAEFIHDTDHTGSPLTTATYIAYTTAHPGTMPAADVDTPDDNATPDETGDLDYRYLLQLTTAQRRFRYVVHERTPDRIANQWRTGQVLTTRRELYEAAARMCEQLAINTERQMNRNSGFGLPGQPSPDQWRQQAHAFDSWLDTTNVDLLELPGPTAAANSQYTTAQARAAARQVTQLLHRHHPGVKLRTSMTTHGVLTLTVPARFATDQEASWLAHLIGNLLGRRYTVHIPPNQPTRTGVRATLTLHPSDAAQHLEPAPRTTDATAP